MRWFVALIKLLTEAHHLPVKTIDMVAQQYKSINQGPRSTNHRPPPAAQPLTEIQTWQKTPTVTPVLGPRSMELGSGKVANKVLIVDHTLCSAKLLL